ncbi:MAG: aspartate carbamoyltransferase catalytic subunit [SAR202 cluster bacterium]|nr:aspartate carbamoyltransferase catalytic subunit [SAR202 cluster bacterium]|tara:strand:+ start:5448 stop:6407 length:960 start_codon:yes stop_codon:yes gene_type:complete
MDKRHVLDLDTYSKKDIESLLENTVEMKKLLQLDTKKIPSLNGKTVVNIFLEASTRTRVSFERAAKILSADVINVSGSGSSIEKGESLYNTALTLQAMNADIIIVRHPHAGAPYFLSRHLDASVINAGDGSHAHPTQAMLDLYTVYEKFGKIQNLKIAIIGDILHSRVARSNIWGFVKLGAQLVLCGPKTLLPKKFESNLQQIYQAGSKNIRVENDLRAAVKGVDVVMALRLQKERQKHWSVPSIREYANLFCVTPEIMKHAKKSCIVMHPGPMNEGVEIETSVAHSKQSVVEDQVTNGLAVRMAVLQNVTLNNIGKNK